MGYFVEKDNMAKKRTDESKVREDLIRLIDDYFIYPTDDRFSFMVDIRKAEPDKRLDAMTRILQVCFKNKQDINLGISNLGEVYMVGKNGEKIDE